jgi:hypothetical protein
MILPLLLDSAMRSLLLGTVAWGLLKVLRLRDTRTETAIWTAVLMAALLMPLLSRHLPGFVLTLPHLTASTPEGTPGLPQVRAIDAQRNEWRALTWLAHHGWACLTALYALGLMACAARLVAGPLLTLGLYRRSTPVHADWSEGRNIRTSVELSSPVSFAGAILLPVDCHQWSAAKRDAVLAHEEAHIARGDFYVQLGALIHCACFWFSPFAWWLKSKLAEIAETASDEAAILHLDRVAYAEILVDVSRRAHRAPLTVGIAKSSLIRERIEHILSEAPKRVLSLPARVLSLAALVALAVTVASAKAVFAGGAVKARPKIALAQIALAKRPPASPQQYTAASTAASAVQAPRTTQPQATAAMRNPDAHTYNPKALLDPTYAPRMDHVPASTIVHGGREFYVSSSEHAVADVTVSYELDRQRHPSACTGDSPCGN